MAAPMLSTSPVNTPIPDVAKYGQAGLLAKTAYQNTLAKINRSRSQLVQQFGYKADVDPNSGVMTNLHVDPHNPYGNLQAMYRNHAAQAEGARFEAQERGLHGGLANKAATDLAYARGLESSQLGTTLSGDIADLQDQQTGAKYDLDRALYEAERQAAEEAIANANFTPAGNNTTQNTSSQSNTSTTTQSNDTDAARFAAWLAGQAAAAGQFRSNSPRGIRGTYIS